MYIASLNGDSHYIFWSAQESCCCLLKRSQTAGCWLQYSQPSTMRSPSLVLLALLLALPSLLPALRVRSASSVAGSFLDDAIATKGAVLKKAKAFLPLIGFYAAMLAPIYGNGIFPGSTMTDFTTLTNRNIKGVVSNEYIVAPD